MKKDYIKPETKCTPLLSEEIMEVTSQIGMGGTTDRFDARMRIIISEEEEQDIRYGNLW